MVTAAVVATSMLWPGGSPQARDGEVATNGKNADAASLEWARSLPEGEATVLPVFGEGGKLWSGGQAYDVPAEVDRTLAPRAVQGGWLVRLGHGFQDTAYAILTADGQLRSLPVNVTPDELFDTAVAISPDGSKVAFGKWLLDVETRQATVVPHAPEQVTQDGYVTTVRVLGFTEFGLVYEAAPYAKGSGTHWLLGEDGEAVEIDPPADAHIRGGGRQADIAVTFDYSKDNSDTCVSTWLLDTNGWDASYSGCMGQYLGEALAVSPEREWLLTDDLPKVWNIVESRWDSVDIPATLPRTWGESIFGRMVWEDADHILFTVSDVWNDRVPIGEHYDHRVQLVRCSLTDGACERAGAEQQVRVETDRRGTTELRLAE